MEAKARASITFPGPSHDSAPGPFKIRGAVALRMMEIRFVHVHANAEWLADVRYGWPRPASLLFDVERVDQIHVA